MRSRKKTTTSSCPKIKSIIRATAGALCELASLSASAGVVTIAAGETQTYSFNNFGYYQSYDKGTYPSMPEQFSFFIGGFSGTTPGTSVNVKVYEDSTAQAPLFSYNSTFSAAAPDFGVSQALSASQMALWTDLQGVIRISVDSGSLSFNFLNASTTFVTPVNPNFLVQYVTGDILLSTAAPMPISPPVDASDPQGGGTTSSGGSPTAVPEPGTAALLASALGLLAMTTRLRKHA